MNTLSWLLLLADMVPGGLVALATATAVAAALFGLGWFFHSLETQDTVYWPVKPTTIVVLCIVLGALVPSKQTIYLIAASELGEKVAKTQEAAELYDAVRRKVREVLGPTASGAEGR